MRKLIFTISFMILALFLKAQDLSGSWNGVLKLGDRNITIVFNVKKSGEVYATTMDSPSQYVKGFSTSSTTFVDSILTIRMDEANMQYQAGLMKNNELNGIFTQMGKSYALNMMNGSKPEFTSNKKRQKRNFTACSYSIDTISITNSNLTDVKAVLYQPLNTKKTAAVVLICDFDKQAANSYKVIKEFSELSDYLCSNGFVVFCMDKSNYIDSKNETVNYLKLCSFVNPNKISIVKFSETNLVASYHSVKSNSQLKKEISKHDSDKNSAFNQLTQWLLKLA